MNIFYFQRLKGESGAVAVIVALLLIVFISFTAFAIDRGRRYVVKNQLQNAADAGALAGATYLLDKDTGAITEALAKSHATSAAALNNSEQLAVTVAAGDVHIGHWSFGSRKFTALDGATSQGDLWDKSWSDLDNADGSNGGPAFICAVQVTARRDAKSFFGKYKALGYDSYPTEATAVAYIGFAGTIEPFGVDQPIAICQESILNDDDAYTCNMGRMISSNNNVCDSNTGAWTNFTQQPCETAGPPSVRPLVCGDGNPNTLVFNVGMGETNGMTDEVFRRFRDCWWQNSAQGTRPWKIKLPVIRCEGYPGPVSNCAPLVGAVEVNVMWIHRDNKNQCDQPGNYPTTMAGIPGDGDWPGYGQWDSPDSSNAAASWLSFFSHFHIQNVDPNCPIECEKKSIYFLPDCTPHQPTGTTGGQNFGIRAEYPLLVN